jgi:hypothetical protein
MANQKKQNVSITNRDENKALFKGLPEALKNRVMAKSVNAALKPVVRSAKKFLTMTSRRNKRTGLLRKSINLKVKKYPSGVIFGAAGPDKETIGYLNGRKQWPNKYAHLVEFGTQPHFQPKANRWHKGSKAKSFLETGYGAVKSEVLNIIEESVKNELEKEVKKLNKAK